ncbi:MAG: winged helix-turn-helix domain-containing protein [Caldilineaceae bacterium]
MVEPEASRGVIQEHPWVDHAPTYRAHEVQRLASWILTAASGSVIGLSGSGKSDLLGFLCHRPEVLNGYLPARAQPVTLLPMDLNNLPDRTLAALFRVILRTFAEHQRRFAPETQALIARLYQENRAATDPFLSQSALRELLIHLQQQRQRVVFALDRFDIFCHMLTPEMGDALRGLRDGFKGTLSYIASMRLGLAYLPEPEVLGDLHRLLDQHVCYVGPMNEQDTRDTIARRVQVVDQPPTAAEIEAIWRLSGGYPSLVMVLCRWWLTHPQRPELSQWQAALPKEASVRHRLEDIWAGLTQEEQLVLAEVQKSTLLDAKAQQAVGQRYTDVLENLVDKGLCIAAANGWRLFSRLFADHVAQVGGYSRGKIWLERETQTLYHGQQVLAGLTPKERALLQFLVEQPRQQHTYTDVIVAAWTDEERYHGVTNDSLFQVVRGLRQKIEPTPSHPVYVVNWRGKPEGGYQFFPEGRPR